MLAADTMRPKTPTPEAYNPGLTAVPQKRKLYIFHGMRPKPSSLTSSNGNTGR